MASLTSFLTLNNLRIMGLTEKDIIAHTWDFTWFSEFREEIEHGMVFYCPNDINSDENGLRYIDTIYVLFDFKKLPASDIILKILKVRSYDEVDLVWFDDTNMKVVLKLWID